MGVKKKVLEVLGSKGSREGALDGASLFDEDVVDIQGNGAGASMERLMDGVEEGVDGVAMGSLGLSGGGALAKGVIGARLGAAGAVGGTMSGALSLGLQAMDAARLTDEEYRGEAEKAFLEMGDGVGDSEGFSVSAFLQSLTRAPSTYHGMGVAAMDAKDRIASAEGKIASTDRTYAKRKAQIAAAEKVKLEKETLGLVRELLHPIGE